MLIGVLGLVLIVAFLIWLFWPIIIGAPWVPTPMKVVRRMLELADVHEGDVVIDLGSGDGRILIAAAKERKAKAIGIEADPLRLMWSRRNLRNNGLQKQAKVVWGNFLDKDLGEATVVTIYQSQDINNKLEPKLEKELNPGTRVVSHVFSFNGWEPQKVDNESHVYLYIV